MPTPETKPAAAKTAPRRKPPAPGPKPRTQVVEHTLKCQSDVDGEISLSLLVPYPKMKVMLRLEEDEIPEQDVVDHILENIMGAEDADKLMALQDGAETLEFTMDWMTAVGERLGNSVGKFGPSSD